MKRFNLRQPALQFILLIGIVSLFSDMTHEGASGIMGSYLSLAGASAMVIGFISGLGEFVGYSLRLATGWFTDRTKRYWPMTILGYAIDCLAIPALALVPRGGWKWACVLIVLQRIGKAIKKPAKDTILSFAATQAGVGKSFALHEVMDQLGAFLGPVILFLVLLVTKNGDSYSSYSLGFAILGIPAVLTIVLLLLAKRRFPHPEQFEPTIKSTNTGFRMNRAFLLYIIGISLFACGFLDFPLVTMHALRSNLFSETVLPLLYAGAMAVDAFAALLFGWLFDKWGVKVLSVSTLIAAPFSLFIFLVPERWALLTGVVLWGIGMGAQESILKAAVTVLVPKQNRSSAFGIFQSTFGAFWFAGSWLMGFLYDTSLSWLVVFSILTQLLAVPFFLLSARKQKSEPVSLLS